ncbi:MAG: hypothetical protein ACOVOX_07250, partial [Burkholderiaceae bacterium]
MLPEISAYRVKKGGSRAQVGNLSRRERTFTRELRQRHHGGGEHDIVRLGHPSVLCLSKYASPPRGCISIADGTELLHDLAVLRSVGLCELVMQSRYLET